MLTLVKIQPGYVRHRCRASIFPDRSGLFIRANPHECNTYVPFSWLFCCNYAWIHHSLTALKLTNLSVLQKYYLRTSRQMRLLDLEAKSPLYSHFLESLSGLVTIRTFGWGENFQIQNHAFLDISQKPYYLLFCIQRWLALILDLLVMVLAVILMILVVKFVSFLELVY
jgi:ABC-type multidrug transport system fused ATPase/permease subunit